MLKNDIQCWKCFLNTCKCFLKLSSSLEITERCNDHNYEKCDQNHLDRQKLSNSVKRKAMEDIYKLPSNSRNPIHVFCKVC